MNGIFRLLAACAALFVSGCAYNQLLRMETKDYVATAQHAEAGGRAFYDGIIASDRALWAALHEFDRRCTPPSLRDSYPDPDARGLCSGVPPFKGAQPNGEVDRATFAKQYATLDFVGSYLKALAEASADPELKAADAFKQAAADLDVLFSLTKTGNPLDKDGTAAIQELVGLVDELAQDKRTAEEIRTLIRERGARADAAFVALTEWLMRDDSLENSTRKLKDEFNAFRAIDGRASDAVSGRIIEAHYAGIDAQWTATRRYENCMARAEVPLRRFCAHPEAGLMHLAGQSHRELMGLADGRMNDKQKARFIKLQRAYVFRVASLFLDLTGAF